MFYPLSSVHKVYREELEMRVGGVGEGSVRCDGLDVVLGYIVGKARQYATL